MAIGGIQNTYDIQDYVSKIMEYEKRPLFALQNRKTKMEGQITAWDSINASLKKLQTALGTLQKAETFQTMSTSSSDPSFITATAGVNAAETTYTFSNITLGQSASAISSSALGLLSGSAASITSTEEINTTGGQDADPNETISSGNMNLDAGKTIVPGSFYVNNKQITVTDDDTIYTILSKINSSGANVNATFENDQISIEQDNVGLTYSVRLTGDNTGFLDAMKLASGSEDPDPAYGVYHDYNRDIADSALSGSVQNGYININDITFQINVDNDSVSEIINRINASDAGVLAYYDSVDDKVTLTSIVNGQDITLSNDTAGLFSALNISAQTYTGTDSSFTLNGQAMTRSSNTFELNGTTFTLKSPTDGETLTVTIEKDTDKMQSAIQDFVDKYNDSVELVNEELADGKPLDNNQRLKSMLRRLRTMVTSIETNDGEYNHLSEIGITLNHDSINKTLSLDTTELLEAIEESASSVFSLFAMDTDGDGRYDTDINDDGKSEDEGYTVILDEYIEYYTDRFDGYIDEHKDSINSSMGRLDRRIERMEEQMARKEQQLIDEMTELQEAISRLDNRSYSAMTLINQFSSGG